MLLLYYRKCGVSILTVVVTLNTGEKTVAVEAADGAVVVVVVVEVVEAPVAVHVEDTESQELNTCSDVSARPSRKLP